MATRSPHGPHPKGAGRAQGRSTREAWDVAHADYQKDAAAKAIADRGEAGRTETDRQRQEHEKFLAAENEKYKGEPLPVGLYL